ncbi:hypothetical protein [Actinophytocola sp. KF-1]
MFNRMVLRLLGSRARVLIDGGTAAVRYRAHRGHTTVALPVQYERDGEDVVIRSGHAGGKRWWRHFRHPAPLEMWLDGRWHETTAEVTDHDGATDVVTVRAHIGTWPATLTGARLFRTWLATVTVAEVLGFAAPALLGALTAAAPIGLAMPVVVLGGVAEGAMLGWGQSIVLRRAIDNFPAHRWIGYTSAGAAFAYVLGMLPAAVSGTWTVAAGIALPLLLSIGTAQWFVLRNLVPWAKHWITATAGAWLAGLTVFLTFATPLWQPGQPLTLTILISLGGGLLMAATVAAVTGLALRTFTTRGRPPR